MKEVFICIIFSLYYYLLDYSDFQLTATCKRAITSDQLFLISTHILNINLLQSPKDVYHTLPLRQTTFITVYLVSDQISRGFPISIYR